jgi:Tol biopolymer transport system component
MRLRSLFTAAVLLVVPAMLAGCLGLAASVTDPVVSELSGESTATPGTTAAPEATPDVVPTPIGGSDAPLIFLSERGAAGSVDLYQINPDGSGLARLTSDPLMERYPRWSPDRQHIAYVSGASADQIYLLSTSEYTTTLLTEVDAPIAGLTWSPDGSQLALIEDASPQSIVLLDATTGEEIDRHVLEVDDAAHLDWQPTRQQIAFSAQTDGPGGRDIFRMSLNDGLLVNLTNHAGDDEYASWSPDGERIVFQTDRDGSFDIYVMQANGSLQTPLTSGRGDEIEPHWSADGKLIAYSATRDGLLPDEESSLDLYVMAANGSDAREIAPVDAHDRQPRWPPASRTVVDELAYAAGPVDGSRNLFLIDVTGAQASQLSRTDADDTTPAWSPDGNQIVFSSNRSGSRELYIMEYDDGDAVAALTTNTGSALHPDWSPDGSRIAFEAKSGAGDWEVLLVDSAGGNLQNVSNTPDANDGNPAWSPDGTQIAFSSNRAGTYDLYVLTLDNGGEAQRVTDGIGNEVYPSWSPDGGTLVFRAESAEGNHQLYVVTLADGVVEPLFTSPYNDDSPDWSASGERILFSSDRAGVSAIYVYNVRTARVDRVNQGTRDARYPAWRPRTALGP